MKQVEFLIEILPEKFIFTPCRTATNEIEAHYTISYLGL